MKMPETNTTESVVSTKDVGTEGKNVREREEITSLKKKFNTFRKYSFVFLVASGAILLLLFFLKPNTNSINAFFSKHPILGYALELKTISFRLMLLFYLSFIVWYGSHALKIVQQFESGVIRMFGKWRRTKKAGLCLIFYPFETIKFMGIYERRIDVVEQPVYSSDNIKAGANAIFWVKIENAAAALLNIDDWEKSVSELLTTAIRSSSAEIPILCLNASRENIKTYVELVFQNKAIPKKDKILYPDEVLSPSDLTEKKTKEDSKEKKKEEEKGEESKKNGFRKKICRLLTFFYDEGMDKEGWGIKLTRTEIQEFKLPADLEGQLEKVLIAGQKVKENEGLRDARIKEAEGQSQAKKLDYDAQIAGLKGLIDAAGGKEAYAMLKVAEGLPEKTMIVSPETFAGIPVMIAQAIDLSKKKMGQQPKD
jgi:regulator of protease activity HflC (stomatin/prohibitin superfamily)